jgi:hypothetical protein
MEKGQFNCLFSAVEIMMEVKPREDNVVRNFLDESCKSKSAKPAI